MNLVSLILKLREKNEIFGPVHGDMEVKCSYDGSENIQTSIHDVQYMHEPGKDPYILLIGD